MRRLAEHYAEQPTRKRLKEKNPAEVPQLRRRSSRRCRRRGIANTMRGVQSRRPPLYAHKDRIAAMATPALVILGEEDEACVKPSHFLTETLPGAHLEVFAGTRARASISRRRRWSMASSRASSTQSNGAAPAR